MTPLTIDFSAYFYITKNFQFDFNFYYFVQFFQLVNIFQIKKGKQIPNQHTRTKPKNSPMTKFLK